MAAKRKGSYSSPTLTGSTGRDLRKGGARKSCDGTRTGLPTHTAHSKQLQIPGSLVQCAILVLTSKVILLNSTSKTPHRYITRKPQRLFPPQGSRLSIQSLNGIQLPYMNRATALACQEHTIPRPTPTHAKNTLSHKAIK